jgi:hypothetical protein
MAIAIAMSILQPGFEIDAVELQNLILFTRSHTSYTLARG